MNVTSSSLFTNRPYLHRNLQPFLVTWCWRSWWVVISPLRRALNNCNALFGLASIIFNLIVIFTLIYFISQRFLATLETPIRLSLSFSFCNPNSGLSDSLLRKCLIQNLCPYLLLTTKSEYSYRTRIRRKTLIMCSWSKFTSSAMPSTRASWSPSCLLYCSPVTLRHYHIQSSRQTTVSASNALCATLSIVLPGLMS